MNNNFIGKIVAVRGIGSGVNVGKCIAIDGVNILLEPNSYFCRSWEYPSDSHGAFHSLSNGKIKGGTITRIERDTIITDAAQIVVCADNLLTILEGFAKS